MREDHEHLRGPFKGLNVGEKMEPSSDRLNYFGKAGNGRCADVLQSTCHVLACFELIAPLGWFLKEWALSRSLVLPLTNIERQQELIRIAHLHPHIPLLVIAGVAGLGLVAGAAPTSLSGSRRIFRLLAMGTHIAVIVACGYLLATACMVS